MVYYSYSIIDPPKKTLFVIKAAFLSGPQARRVRPPDVEAMNK